MHYSCQLKNVSNKQNKSDDESSESYYESSSAIQQQKTRRSKKRINGKITKLQMKRMRNRQAAKKSRLLKKQHIQQLKTENSILKLQNDQLLVELQQLKDMKGCWKCSGSIFQEVPQELDKPIGDIYPEEQHLSQFQLEIKERQEDDISYQRLTEDKNKHKNLKKLFLMFVFVAIILLVQNFDIKHNLSSFPFKTLYFKDCKSKQKNS